MCSFFTVLFIFSQDSGYHISQQQTETQPTNRLNFSSFARAAANTSLRLYHTDSTRKSVHYGVFIHKSNENSRSSHWSFGCFPLPAQTICVSCFHLAHYGKCFSAPSVQASSSYQAPQQNTQLSFPFQPLAAMFHQQINPV